MELGSKNLLASTYDNVEATFKRILIFISEAFDKINRFHGRQESCKIPVIGQVNCSSDRLFLAVSHSHRYTKMSQRCFRNNLNTESYKIWKIIEETMPL